MNKSFGLLFNVKKSKMTADGTAPVYLRITIDGERIEISSKRYLKTLELEVYEVHRTLIEKKLPLTAINLKNVLLKKEAAPGTKMLIPIFEEHNYQVKVLLGKEYTKGTHERYETSLKHTKHFLLWKYNVSDIDISAINHEFIASYDFYLRSERACNNNSTVKYLKNFKKIILICIANGWPDKDGRFCQCLATGNCGIAANLIV